MKRYDCSKNISGFFGAASSIKEISKNLKKQKMQGIHIHVPEGATPKDGPSAGQRLH